MNREYTSVKRILDQKYGDRSKAQASSYITQVSSQLHSKVVLWVRVSTAAQAKNLEKSIRTMRRACEGLGLEIVGVAKTWVNGTLVEFQQPLRNAAELAKSLGAVLLAESTCRFIRSPFYHPVDRPDEVPAIGDFERLMKVVGGVPLATLLHPDQPARSFQTKRGLTGVQNGRPRKREPGWSKRRKDQKLPLVLNLRAEGRSYSEISSKIGICPATAWKWCREASFIFLDKNSSEARKH